MAIQVEKLTREFAFQGVKLPDPNPKFSVEQVRDMYVAQYPELATAAVNGPESRGDKLVYSFIRAVGAKG
jgi:PRTRC genetic system protein C